MSKQLELLHNLKVGIVGYGHLGQAITQVLLKQGIKKENLLISYGGSPQTYQKLAAKGLDSCLTTNYQLFQSADIVFITLKPQDIFVLKAVPISNEVLVVSCMAGVSTEMLDRILGKNVYRMMFSGPDTIASGKGVVAMYPENDPLKALLYSMNQTYVETMTEADLDIFTAGVCMPAAILKGENPDQQKKAIDRISAEYPLLSELYTWALGALPSFQDGADKKAYIERMITKGGVTEAIIKSLISGEPLDTSLRKGIARTKEIVLEIQQSIDNRKQE